MTLVLTIFGVVCVLTQILSKWVPNMHDAQCTMHDAHAHAQWQYMDTFTLQHPMQRKQTIKASIANKHKLEAYLAQS